MTSCDALFTRDKSTPATKIDDRGAAFSTFNISTGPVYNCELTEAAQAFVAQTSTGRARVEEEDDKLFLVEADPVERDPVLRTAGDWKNQLR
ncbi:unnamed protein product, partial [Amoebophrya sp. A120]|eukprot:GSA120T00010234001.1